MHPITLIISLLIVVAITFVLIWRHAKLLESRSSERWEDLWLLLYHRHNILPNLLETFRSFFPNESALISETIKAKDKAAHIKNPGPAKVHAEVELTLKIAEIMQKIQGGVAIQKDTNFLELKHELRANSHKIEGALALYNDKIREHNAFLERWFVRIIAQIFSIKALNIFEFEGGV